MIKLTIGSEIEIEGLSMSESQDVKNWLTVMNPLFDVASRMNKALFGIPPKLLYYREEHSKLIVPIGILPTLKELYPNSVVIDARYEAKNKLKINFTGTLRDYQEDAVKAMESNPNGVLCCLTGGGKSCIMIKRMCDVGQPTLILVNTVELANQFVTALLTFTDLKKDDIGFLGAGKKDIKPITVALLQTVVTMDVSALKFGMIIFDECHQSPAQTYFTAMSKLSAKYKYACSSTPERADGLTKVIFWATGPLVHTVPMDKLTTILVKPTVKTIDTSYYFPLFSSEEYQAMVSDLSRDAARNKLIIEELKNYPKQQIAILCQRKEQVQLLQEAIPGSVILTSDMGKKARVAVMKGLLDGTHKVVISTYQLFSTGLDIPTLEVLFMAAPIKSVVKVRQSAGRLMRTTTLLPNKKPIIVDFADKKVELLKHQWYQRSRILRTL